MGIHEVMAKLGKSWRSDRGDIWSRHLKRWTEIRVGGQDLATTIWVHRLEGTKAGHAPKIHLRPITIYRTLSKNSIYSSWIRVMVSSSNGSWEEKEVVGQEWCEQSGFHNFYPMTFKADSTVLLQAGVSTSHCSSRSHLLDRRDNLLSHV